MYRLGHSLRALRLKRGMSQEQVAIQARITPRTLRYWESDNYQMPRLVELENVLKALEATPSERVEIYALLPDRRRNPLVQQGEGTRNIPASLLGPLPGSGDMIRTMRMRRGWTQEQFADEMRINRSTIFRWESTRTVPSEDDSARLCGVLGALPHELAALQSGRLSPSHWPPQLTLEECRQQYETLMQIRKGDFALLPLMDLYALALKLQLRPLLSQSSEALSLLAKVEALHGWWLFMQGRKAEACAGNWRALNLTRGATAPDYFFVDALNILSAHAMSGAGGPENGVKLLYPWLRLLSPALHICLLCDMALYAGMARRQEEAASFLQQAERSLHSRGQESKINRDYFHMTKARVLLLHGKALEALDWLPPVAAGDGHIHELMIWAEMYLAAGEKDAAARCLNESQALLTLAPLPARQKTLDQLARQL